MNISTVRSCNIKRLRQDYLWRRHGRVAVLPACQMGTHQHSHLHVPRQLHVSTSSSSFLRRVLHAHRDHRDRDLVELSAVRFTQKEPPLHGKLLQEASLRAVHGMELLADGMHVLVTTMQSAWHKAISSFLLWIHSLSAVFNKVSPHEQKVVTKASQAAAPLQASSISDTMHNRVGYHDSISSEVAQHDSSMAPTCSIVTKDSTGPWQEACQRLQCSVAAVEHLPPVAMVLSCSPMQRVGLLVGALLAVVMPPFVHAQRLEMARRRQLDELVEMNALGLQRQKQRFHQALKVDSINLELPDIKDTQVNPNNAKIVAVQSALRLGQQKNDMRREWESFMAGSKTEQVKDVWDAKADDGAPRATKKQLEEMTARVRAASTGNAAGKKDYVSFDELCGQNDDFDAHRDERVAQRKARFQGQFLTDEDVGQRPAPQKRGAIPSLGLGSSGSGAAASSRAAAPSASVRAEGGSVSEDSIASRRRRLGLGESRARLGVEDSSWGSREGSNASTSSEGPLLEIRPKKGSLERMQLDALGQASSSTPSEGPLLEIRPKKGTLERMQLDAMSQGSAGPSSTPLLEIRPKKGSLERTQHDASQASVDFAESTPSPRLPEIRPRRGFLEGTQPDGSQHASPSDAASNNTVFNNISNWAGAMGVTSNQQQQGSQGSHCMSSGSASGLPATPNAPRSAVNPMRPLKLSVSSVDIDDQELQQSLQMRSSLDYIHPSMAAAAKQAPPGSNSKPVGSSPTTQQVAGRIGSNRATSGVRLHAEPGQQEAAAVAETDDDCAALPVPVSGVSLGLLRGASLKRLGSELRKQAVSEAAAGVEAADGMQQAQEQALGQLMRRPGMKQLPQQQL